MNLATSSRSAALAPSRSARRCASVRTLPPPSRPRTKSASVTRTSSRRTSSWTAPRHRGELGIARPHPLRRPRIVRPAPRSGRPPMAPEQAASQPVVYPRTSTPGLRPLHPAQLGEPPSAGRTSLRRRRNSAFEPPPLLSERCNAPGASSPTSSIACSPGPGGPAVRDRGRRDPRVSPRSTTRRRRRHAPVGALLGGPPRPGAMPRSPSAASPQPAGGESDSTREIPSLPAARPAATLCRCDARPAAATAAARPGPPHRRRRPIQRPVPSRAPSTAGALPRPAPPPRERNWILLAVAVIVLVVLAIVLARDAPGPGDGGQERRPAHSPSSFRGTRSALRVGRSAPT